jgi:hypothetical protein
MPTGRNCQQAGPEERKLQFHQFDDPQDFENRLRMFLASWVRRNEEEEPEQQGKRRLDRARATRDDGLLRAPDWRVRLAYQVHGAIGFTHEHSLHRLTRRLWSWRDEFGTESHWSRELGKEVLAAGADALWPMITAG